MSENDSRARLIAAAQTIFAQKGYDGTTVKELADAAGVNISLVSYYFDGKEGLYRSCIEEVGRGRLETANRILQPPGSMQDLRVRLRLFVEEFFTFHLEKRDICTIMERETTSAISSAIRDIFKDTFLKAYEKLDEFFAHAQKIDLIRADVDVKIMSFQLFSMLVTAHRYNMISTEFYGKTLEDKTYREEFIEHILKFFLSGYLKET
jgi:TetR/AcrR family transcriptional regulator